LALSGTFELLPIHTRHFFPGELTLSVGEPIETVGMSLRQTEELTAQLKNAISELLKAVHPAASSGVEVELAGTVV
jgi:1-acyl-sn-glycerol-3-phosphate acyltransferase